MLLQLEHQHKNKQQASTSPKIQQVGNSRVTKKQQNIEQQQSIFFNPQFYHETSSFNFHIDGLQQLHKLSVGQLPQFIIKRIEERKKFSQQRVYQATVQTSVDFVGIHMRDFKFGMKHQMQNMFETIHNSVQAGIWDGRYEINQSRNKYFSLAKKQKELLSFITGELVKRNLDSFRQQLEQQEAVSETFDLSSSHHAKSENYKTKKAEGFVKKMQEEQARHQSQLQRQIQVRKMKQIKTLQEKRHEEQQKMQQKKQQVKRRFQKQSEIIGLQKQRRQKIHSEYLKMVSSSSYKKPLYKQRQQRYNKMTLEQQKKKYRLLKQLKQDKRPINFDDIQEHMAKYQQLRQQNESFRQQRRQLKQSEYQIIASKKPYRSKFYSLVAKQQQKLDDSIQRLSLLKKQQDYAEHVKNNYAPKIDEKKQQEIQQLMKQINGNKNDNYARRHLDQGKKNLERLHLLIGELRAKNKIKQNISIDELMKSKQPGIKYKNYLQQIRQSKIQNPINHQQQSDNFHNIMSKKDHQQIKLFSKRKQEKAKLKQHFLNHSIQNIDIHTHMKGNSIVEQNYIQSAAAKLALLKKYQLEDAISPQEGQQTS